MPGYATVKQNNMPNYNYMPRNCFELTGLGRAWKQQQNGWKKSEYYLVGLDQPPASDCVARQNGTII